MCCFSFTAVVSNCPAVNLTKADSESVRDTHCHCDSDCDSHKPLPGSATIMTAAAPLQTVLPYNTQQ